MHDSTSRAGRDAYDQTLAHYHTWFVRNGALIAMYSLPTKHGLLSRVSRILFVQIFYLLFHLNFKLFLIDEIFETAYV